MKKYEKQNAGIPDEELTPEQMKKRRDAKKNFAILGKPSLMSRSYELSVNFVRAEDLPKLGMGTVDW